MDFLPKILDFYEAEVGVNNITPLMKQGKDEQGKDKQGKDKQGKDVKIKDYYYGNSLCNLYLNFMITSTNE